ncbi:putative S8 family [Rosellinia necatrix]|uniref:Putative S8 family n=1 Tax=Rosellinia necatrix TaxID=77044 RepID=A0A1S8AB17_ROSNE|nr:putative S8 family [Rosellinia necatrix]
MAHAQEDPGALQLVASIALTCFDILFPLAVRHKSGAAAKVAILLKSIAENLQELSKIPPDAQAGSTNVLRDLLRIAEWPPRQNQLHREKSPYELWSALVHRPDLQTQLSVTKFCKERPNIIEPFGSRFADFLGMLTKNITGSQHALVHSAAYLPPPPKDEYPDQVHKLLLDGVKRYAACIMEDHVGPELQGTAKANWHITRLCLESGFCSEDQRVLFKLITTASKMTHWQELAFRIPIMNTKSKNAHESQQGQGTFDTPTLIANGDACKSLDNPIFAGIRIELGEDYHLYQLQEPEQLKRPHSRAEGQVVLHCRSSILAVLQLGTDEHQVDK